MGADTAYDHYEALKRENARLREELARARKDEKIAVAAIEYYQGENAKLRALMDRPFRNSMERNLCWWAAITPEEENAFMQAFDGRKMH